MDENDEAIELFKKVITKRSLQNHWRLRALGYDDVESKIQELEAEVYPQIRDGLDPATLWQKDIDELQVLLALEDERAHPLYGAAIKVDLFKMGYTVVKMLPDKNHFRPHFHVQYKQECAASYAVDTLERLAGEMPRQYEKPILEWAARKQKSLKLTWDELKAGKDVRELVLHADEDSILSSGPGPPANKILHYVNHAILSWPRRLAMDKILDLI